MIHILITSLPVAFRSAAALYLILSLLVPVSIAFAWDGDLSNEPAGYSDYSTSPSHYGGGSLSGGEQARADAYAQERRANEAYAAQQAERMNAPTTYGEPSYTNPTPTFNVYGPRGTV